MSSPAEAQLGAGGTAAATLQANGPRASYGPPSPTASFLCWDIILNGGIGVLTDHIGSDSGSASDLGILWGRAGPQLGFVYHWAVFGLRADYEYSNLSRATLGAEVDAGGLVNEHTYAGAYVGGVFDVDGSLDAAHQQRTYARAGLRTGLTAGPFSFEYDRRNFPSSGLYGENVLSVTFTLSYAFFEETVGFPPLPGRTIARFED